MTPKDRLKWKLRAFRAVLGPLLSWDQREAEIPGYSIVLGTPWFLRHLLPVNLRFVERCDLEGLHAIHVIFDRPEQPGGAELIEATRKQFPSLPLDFRFHPPLAGRFVRKANNASLFACTNWTLGVKACRTRYAIMHDFDLYPVEPDHFRAIHRAMEDEGLAFSGSELTLFDGLSEEDGIIGTWALGVDVNHLRTRYRPIRIYQTVAKVNGKLRNLDGFSHLQSMTDRKRLAPGKGGDAFCHANNLCSVYLRYRSGQEFSLAWRLHFLWYLESLCEPARDLTAVIRAMEEAEPDGLRFEDHRLDFSGVHHTCAIVLDRDVTPMERALFGEVRPVVRDYLASFGRFLDRFGDHAPRSRGIE